MKKIRWLFFASVALLAACNENDKPADGSNNNNNGNMQQAPAISYSIIASYPHDTSSFTQGLAFYNGKLYEGTGNLGKSKLLEVDLKSGKAVKQISLDPKHFGEGVTILNDTIYQLTWQEHVVHVYSAKDFKKIKEFTINTEGWGITHDGKNLIVTDGSSNLYFYEPSTFKLLKVQSVIENGSPTPNLNEIEFIKGFIYANQWQYPYILKIDPATGQVVGKLDLTNEVARLKTKIPDMDNKGAYLNGIAYHPETDKIYITGKNWPEMLEIQFAH